MAKEINLLAALHPAVAPDAPGLSPSPGAARFASKWPMSKWRKIAVKKGQWWIGIIGLWRLRPTE